MKTNKSGTGIGRGHGSNTPNLPLIREVEDWAKDKGLRIGDVEPDSRFFRMGTEISIILSQTDQWGWHMSIAHRKRLPTWDEIAYARYELIPNEVTMALMLPPKEQYINLHSFCMQMHQVFDKESPDQAFVRVNNESTENTGKAER